MQPSNYPTALKPQDFTPSRKSPAVAAIISAAIRQATEKFASEHGLPTQGEIQGMPDLPDYVLRTTGTPSELKLAQVSRVEAVYSAITPASREAILAVYTSAKAGNGASRS